MKNINWDDLRYFLSVARTGSLTGSAAELQVSQSTVSRRISALEQDLHTTLFARHATGYFLTDQGRDVLRKVSAVEDSITALHIGLADLDANTEGTIRLATPESLAVNMIIPALPEFISRYPKLRLEIISGVGVADLSRYEADLAIRLVRPQSGNLIMQRLGVMNSAIYASADYLQRLLAIRRLVARLSSGIVLILTYRRQAGWQNRAMMPILHLLPAALQSNMLRLSRGLVWHYCHHF